MNKDSLHVKGILAFFWSAINTGGMQFIGLLFSIILARILSPEDFGNMAIIVFVALIANVFVDSGLSHALIREQKVTNLEYDSVFFFSIIIAIICSLIIYFSAEYLADFFNSPVLKDLAKLMSISPIIYALMSINSTIITKNLDFKLKAKLSITSIIVSGLVGTTMAYNGFGVWSLLIMQILGPTILMILMYLKVNWRPQLHFSYLAILKYFSFGVKLSLSNLANILYSKSYVMILGKGFSAEEAGYFSRADNLKDIPTTVLGKIIMRAAYPFLSRSQDNSKKLREYNVKIIKFTALIAIPIMFGMAAIVEPLIVFLIGEKWLQSADILFYLCFAGVLFPFDLINLNVIKVHGKMNLYLAIELVKIVMVVPVLYIAVYLGLKAMLLAIIAHAFFSFSISTIFSGRYLNYGYMEYLLDIKQPVLLSLIMFFILVTIKDWIDLFPLIELTLLISIGISIMILLYEIFDNTEYAELKSRISGGLNEQ